MERRIAGPGVYEFGDFRLDEARRILSAVANGARIPIAPKVFDAGLYFVEHAGELLPKAQLLAQLWPGMVVEENSLTQAICDLRRALGEGRGDNRYVVTVPRRGYQFVAEVRRMGTMHEHDPSADHTVTVLPFDNLSRRARDEPIATGIAASIAHRLVGTDGLRLVMPTAAFASKGTRAEDAHHVGRRLGSRYLVTGSVQHWGPRLRITAQLIDATDGARLWSLMFDRGVANLFAVEDEVANAVAQALCRSLCPTTAGDASATSHPVQGAGVTGTRKPPFSAASNVLSRP
jgi:TolB-like protein